MRILSKGSLPAALAAAALLIPQWAAAKPVTLAPSTNWEVNHDKDTCVLARIFGEGDDRTGIYFTRFEPGDDFQLTLVSKYARTRSYSRAPIGSASVGSGGDSSQIEVKLQFGPAEEAFRMNTTPATGEGGVKAMISSSSVTVAGVAPSGEGEEKWLNADLSNPYRISPEREAAVTEVVFHSGLTDELTLRTGSLGKPFAILRDCNEWLLGKWGMDVEKHRHLTRRASPIGAPSEWFRSADYPTNMLNQLRTGLVYFRLLIDPDGTINDCTVQRSPMPMEFAVRTCELVKRRGRFEPALDAGGQPIKSYWLSAVRWVL